MAILFNKREKVLSFLEIHTLKNINVNYLAICYKNYLTHN